jgi:hypothetical protein
MEVDTVVEEHQAFVHPSLSYVAPAIVPTYDQPHPVGGPFPSTVRAGGIVDVKGHEDLYEVNDHCQVRRKRPPGRSPKGWLRPSNLDKVRLCGNGQDTMLNIGRIALRSFFPDMEVKQTINHIDGNHDNWSVMNLEFHTLSENVLHSNGRHRRDMGPAQSKAVQQLDGQTGAIVKTFVSMHAAARETGIALSAVVGAAHKGSRAGGYRWAFVPQPDLPGELWRRLPTPARKELQREYGISDKTLKRMLVSNRGRITTARGIKVRGPSRSETKALSTKPDGKCLLVHVLVFLTFHPLPPDWKRRKELNKVIAHDDKAPLVRVGRYLAYRNWAEDLRYDTQRNNMIESYQHGARAAIRKRKNAQKADNEQAAQKRHRAV